MQKFDHITAVTLDVGGTLIRPEPSVGHVYASVAARHGFTVSPTRLNQQFSHAWKQQANFNHEYAQWAAVVDATFAGLIDTPPSRTFFAEIYERFREPEVWHIYKDAIPALDRLAALGLDLALISNWDDRLGPLLASLGLAKYFQAILISCDIGFTKPSPVIFQHAARVLGTPEANIIHVGDSLEHDVQGAEAAGFRALHLNRNRQTSTEGTITSLLELEALLS